MSSCCGRPSDTGNWKPRLECLVWFFFPKIYALPQLVLLLVLKWQSRSQSPLSQWSPLAPEAYENKQNTNNTSEGYFF